ncbi:cation diffusion facilitator family transporter [Actinobaculum sp. 313]|uniref:cation diffusion facilitator family transporter n=1 Tax=Actinobaculum sp. 313 TaxID=2495645 RepID=UPI00196A565A|nr:cation diffusion facilitator family transporter [Actinobaculum sp. 313]
MNEAHEHTGTDGRENREPSHWGVHGGHGDRHVGHEGGHAGHGEHGHNISITADRRYLWSALLLILGFMLGEVVVAVASGSLALLSDAGHMLSDAGAIAVALWVTHVAQRPAHGAWTYGFTRSEILSGLGNGLTILVVALVILVEAVRRLITPPEVEGVAVVVVAVIGIGVNLLATWLLAKANRSSLNIRGAYQHILTDLYGFIGTAAAGVVIMVTHWTRADAIASILVAAIMIHAGWGVGT